MSLVIARRVLEAEAKAIREVAKRLDGSFEKAVDLIHRTHGRVIVLGMGKPGFIAQKLSSSLASTGIASITLHPADAAHGDLGRIRSRDVLIILSKSGETDEIVRLLPAIRDYGCKIIAITGKIRSSLAKMCDILLDVTIKEEAGPLDVVPTTSTTCMLAMGDALTMALVKRSGFKKRDFAALHPGGMLGKMFHLKVRHVMRRGESNPSVKPDVSVKRTLLQITSARAGAISVVDNDGKCIGIFTDGDLRRRFKDIQEDVNQPIRNFMTRQPLVVYEDQLALDALALMKKKRIDEVPVVDKKKRLVGLLDIQDLIREGFSA